MFTGIVQSVGLVRSIQRGSAGARLVLNAPGLKRPISSGSSICVSGVCLTVTKSTATDVEFDVVPETLSGSTLGTLSSGDRVNLEASLKVGDGLDGHMVQGHVDGIGRVSDIQRGSAGHVFTLGADSSIMAFIIPKGSVSVDGVSLTVAEVGKDWFKVALIPTTLSETTFGLLKVNDRVNIETDIIARTIVCTMQRWGSSSGGNSVTWEMLREQGFV
ncbi:MAG: riboflavin synthase [Planctomycetota bacterium]|jgi:riboflavin synthase